MKKLIAVIALFNFTFSSGQNILVQGRGIQGDSIRISTSSILQVVQKYGDDFEIVETAHAITYNYKKLGLSFSINPYDKNKIIRNIGFEYPFQGQTTLGIILNKTTWEELEAITGSPGGIYAFENKAVCKVTEGIDYYIHKPTKRKGWNKKERVYRIEINERDSHGSFKSLNFFYSKNLEIHSINKLNTFIINNPSLRLLTDYFNNPKEIFDPVISRFEKRIINMGILQTRIHFDIGYTNYYANLLSKGDTIFYMQTKIKQSDSIVYN